MGASLSKRVARLEKPPDYRFLAHVDAVDFLESLDVANITQAKSDEVKFSCPFPGHSHGDERPSAFMNNGAKDREKTTKWACHGCKRRGNAVTFLAEHHQISRTKAARWIKEHYAPGFIAPKDGIASEFEERWNKHLNEREHSAELIRPLDWKMYHQRFGVDWAEYADNPAYEDEPDVQYMFKRGFTPGDLEEWAIGYDSFSGRITIPVCDQDGNLVGIKARAWDPERKMKYMTIGDTPRITSKHGEVYGFEPYEKTKVVFGIHKWGNQERYVFCEGEIDVMSFWRLDVPAFCISGSWLSAEQAQIIRTYSDEVVMFLDNDTAGSRGMWGFDDDEGDHHPGAVEMLEQFVRVKIAPPHLFDANTLMRTGRRDRLLQLVRDAVPSWELHSPELML